MPNGYNSSTRTATVSQADPQLHRRLRELEAEKRKLSMANQRLRKSIRVNGEAARIADRALEDALALANDICAGLPVSVLEAEDRHEMSRRRWEWARAMMRLAGITNDYYLLTVFDPAAIASALLEARDVATDDPSQLRHYLPRSRRRELRK